MMDKIKQGRYDDMYMDIAKRVSQMSWDTDTKVGAIIVKDGNIISMGWNGTPAGFPNECKHPSTGATLPYVIHAEANAITKLARTGGNGSASILYTTLAPCMECTKLILQSGISEVVINEADERYMESYTLLKEKGMVRLCKSISNN
ncbi:dCMP deaminase family protein [Planctomycetota bacterium]|nr:dCMP deaminase family protein [Planctomycetota bacterium]